MSHELLFAAETFLTRQTKSGAPRPLPMWSFLLIDEEPRLILLALLDNATPAEIKAALPFARDPDIRLQSDRMVEGCLLLEESIKDSTLWIEPGPADWNTWSPLHDLSDPTTPFPYPAHLAPPDTEYQLNNVFFPALAALLFGPSVPAAIHALGLQRRCIAYLKTICLYQSREIEELLAVSNWKVKRTMKQLREVLL